LGSAKVFFFCPALTPNLGFCLVGGFCGFEAMGFITMNFTTIWDSMFATFFNHPTSKSKFLGQIIATSHDLTPKGS